MLWRVRNSRRRGLNAPAARRGIMSETGTLADPFVQSGIERKIKQELSSQRLRAALSDPVNIVGGVLALSFCVFAAVAIGLGFVLFGPQSNRPQSNPVRLINAPGITSYSSAPQNRLAEATPNYNTPSNQPLTLGVGKDIPTPSSWGKDTVTPQPQTTWWSTTGTAAVAAAITV
jgi:hypothetical protein